MSENNQVVEELQRVVIKEELMALIQTYYGNKQGIHMRAAYLNNLIFWQGIQLKSDLKEKSKIQRAIQNKVSEKKIQKMKESLRNGWFYKTSEDHQIELMGFCSASSITRMNKEFQEQGWAEIGKNPDPKKKWDKSTWYKLDLVKINEDLNKLGFHLEGFKFSQEEPGQTAPDSIFHGENSIFHDENSIFHGENSNFHDGRTIPEGSSEGLSESISFEEEEEGARVLLSNHSLKLLNDLAVKVGFDKSDAIELVSFVKDKEIANLTESVILKAFEEVQADLNNNYPVGHLLKWTAGKIEKVSKRPNLKVEPRPSKQPKSSKQQPKTQYGTNPKNLNFKPVRTEMLPDWFDESEEERQERVKQSSTSLNVCKEFFYEEHPEGNQFEFIKWLKDKAVEFNVDSKDRGAIAQKLVEAMITA